MVHDGRPDRACTPGAISPTSPLGSNDIANLWPQATAAVPGSREKDRVENYLHDQVCAGRMALLEAQRAIATDWVAVYQQLPTTRPGRGRTPRG